MTAGATSGERSTAKMASQLYAMALTAVSITTSQDVNATAKACRRTATKPPPWQLLASLEYEGAVAGLVNSYATLKSCKPSIIS